MDGKKAVKNKLLACVCALVIGIMSVPVTAYAGDIGNTNFDQQVTNNFVMPMYYSSETVKDGQILITYEGNLTIPYDVYNNTQTGYLLGNIMRKFTFTISPIPANATVRLYQPSIIDSSDPDGIQSMFRNYFYSYSEGGSITVGINCHNVYVSNIPYSGYITLKFIAQVITDSNEYGSNYNNLEVSFTVGDELIGASSFIESAEKVPSTVIQGQAQSNALQSNANELQQEENALQEEANALQEEANTLQEEANATSKNIFEKITDFFDNFFSRLGDFLLGLIVPSSEDLTAFLAEVNEWFSARLGFIWYPFSLALDIVSAFAGGTADTTFKVPGLTLNILGGEHTIWNPIEVDLDAFGIFKYVRMFTSFLLVAGVVKLAHDKWDEWIGGHGVG